MVEADIDDSIKWKRIRVSLKNAGNKISFVQVPSMTQLNSPFPGVDVIIILKKNTVKQR